MSRRWRVGLFDIGAAVLVLIVLVMPGRDLHVASGYKLLPSAEVPGFTSELAQAQAEQLANPTDGAAAEKLAMLLGTRPVNQHDQALRVAGAAAERATPATRWRPLLAASSAHADRIEIEEAHVWGDRALKACLEAGPGCPDHEKLRLDLYAQQLQAGLQAIAEGANPRADPERFRREMSKIHPTTTYRVRSGRAAP